MISINTDPELKMLEFVGNNIKIIIITVFHMFVNSNKIEDIKICYIIQGKN